MLRLLSPRLGVACLMLCSVCSLPLAAAAQGAAAQSDASRDAARAEFNVGLQAAQDGDWERAHEFFERAFELAPLPGVLMNLAGAQRHTGRLLESAASYSRFLEEVTEGRDARHRSTVESALAEVVGAIPTLVIAVDGLIEGDEVRLDGVALADLAAPVRVDPGSHHVSVYRAGREVAEEEVEIEEGHSRDVHVRAPASVPDPAAVAAGVDLQDPVLATASSGDDTPVVVGVVVSLIAALAIAGVVVGVLFATQETQTGFQGSFGPGSVEVALR